MIPLIAGAAIGLVGSIIGGVSASNKAKAADAMLQKEQDSLDNWYAMEIATDFLDTDSAKSTLSYLDKKSKKSEQALSNSLIKSGATAEVKVASASALNQNYAAAMSNMSATDTARKDSAESAYRSASNKLMTQEYNSMLGKSQAVSSIASIASGLGNSLIKLDGAGVFDKKKINKL